MPALLFLLLFCCVFCEGGTGDNQQKEIIECTTQGNSFICEKVAIKGTSQEQEKPLNLEIDCKVVDEIPPTKPMDLSVKIKTEPVDDNENKTDECIFTTPYSQAEATQIAIGVAIANTPDQGNPVIVGLNEEGQIVNIQSDDNAYGVIATTNTGITAGYLINEDKKSIKRKGVEYICEPDFNGEPPPSKKKYKCTKKRSYPCSVEGCYYATSSTVNLTSHMLGKHPGKQTHPDHLICKECHKAFSSHMLKHTGHLSVVSHTCWESIPGSRLTLIT